MNIVFWFLIFLMAMLLWFLLFFMFRPLGMIIKFLYRDMMDEITADDEDEESGGSGEVHD